MSSDEVEQLRDEVEAARDGQSAGPQRVVLRGVRAIVLDDLEDEQRLEIERDHSDRVVEAWVAVASRPGVMDAAVKAYAGQSGAPDARPGKYKAVPHGSWFVSPLVIEPPL